MVRVDEGGGLRADVGPARTAIAGRTVAIDVVVDSAADADLSLTVAGREVRVAPRGAAVETIDLDGADPVFTVVLGDETLVVDGAIRPSAAAELRLSSPRCARWSVTDSSGGAWFPEGVLAKWDVHHRPFFHGHDMTLAVPAELTARGLHPRPGVRANRARRAPGRRRDARRRVRSAPTVRPGGRGLVRRRPARPHELQRRPDLHAGRRGPDAAWRGAPPGQPRGGELGTSLVYDRDMLEQFAGTDLPWSTRRRGGADGGGVPQRPARATCTPSGPSGPPTRYYAGHERSDHPEDWPPNKVACDELRGAGRHGRLPHPAFAEFPDDGSTAPLLPAIPRSVEARELVADAALGVVDSVDLISPFNDEGAVFLYHRLLSCGLRLAATAGTDTFLSFSHGPGVASNPPGWGVSMRTWAIRGLSVAGVQGGHPRRAHGGHQRAVAHLRSERTRTRRRARPGPRRPARHPGPRAGSRGRAPDARRARRRHGGGRRCIRAPVRDDVGRRTNLDRSRGPRRWSSQHAR